MKSDPLGIIENMEFGHADKWHIDQPEYVLVNELVCLFVWFVCLFVWVYDIQTFVDYSMPNPFLYKYTNLIQTIQFSITTLFNCKNISF